MPTVLPVFYVEETIAHFLHSARVRLLLIRMALYRCKTLGVSTELRGQIKFVGQHAHASDRAKSFLTFAVGLRALIHAIKSTTRRSILSLWFCDMSLSI